MRIFVSHSSHDAAFCDQLAPSLRGAGADVWVDQDNLGAGPLLDELMRQLRERPVFVVVLSKAAFASEWVRRECMWAYQLHCREPQRVVLPVVARPIERTDFDSLLFLEEFLRVEAPGNQPYPPQEAVARALRLLSLGPAAGHPNLIESLPARIDIDERIVAGVGIWLARPAHQWDAAQRITRDEAPSVGSYARTLIQ